MRFRLTLCVVVLYDEGYEGERKLRAAKRYFLFADECGHQNLSKHDFNFPVFTLCGIIVTRDQVRNLEREIKALNEQF